MITDPLHDLFQLLVGGAVLAIVGYLVWQHQRNPTASPGQLLREDAKSLEERMRGTLAPLAREWIADAKVGERFDSAEARVRAALAAIAGTAGPAVSSTPAPATTDAFVDGVYVDRDDLMFAAGANAVTQAIRIDGKPARSGAGPGHDFYKQPDEAGISKAKPPASPAT